MTLESKTVIVPGEGPNPEGGDEVEVHYDCYLDTGEKVDSTRERGCPLVYTVNSAAVIPGLEQCVTSMQAGEKCSVSVPPDLAYGDAGSPGGAIPPNTPIKYEVELVSIAAKPRSPSSMSVEERLQAAMDAKEQGNHLLVQGNLQDAHKHYNLALEYFDGLDEPPTELADRVKTMKVSINLNLSNLYLRQGNWVSTILHCSEVLKLDPRCAKALFRRGRANTEFGAIEEGRRDLLEAAKLEPQNAEIRRELENCKRRLREAESRQKDFFSRMLVGACMTDTQTGDRGEVKEGQGDQQQQQPPSSGSGYGGNGRADEMEDG
ncbi:unnamed protein product [Vitrella brassicaformis CCMP3155]|uniref:peptidylprolyl isomerase n=2 Tax=Vitrella brassicaformis TaxID=1169539 RepID=A0A0G4FHV5_VITBC|nr:unnamed protein product [Vitrella brassicaformis CCMP3155]|eukprot:CEM13056.1 unnamed protein product [Vitrella brassicaformis CCMP3155]